MIASFSLFLNLNLLKLDKICQFLGGVMVEIKEVLTKKQQKEFVQFPLKLYKNNPYFVPAIYSDELSIFKSTCIHLKTCDQVFYLAYKDNKLVGRIQGIVQKQYNELNSSKKARFSRFDTIDNFEVASSLLKKVEDWAKLKGLEEIIGPMGYNDLEREGLLIEGFDYISTYEEQYNFPYYQGLIEKSGYVKDVDWLEFRIYPEFNDREVLKKIGERAKQRMKLHIGGENLSKNKYIEKYADSIFHCIDVCYSVLYGTVPMTDEIKKNTISQFKLVLNPKYIVAICDENENVVAFGLLLPGIGSSLQKSGGRLTLPTIIKLLRAIKKPKTLDFALIGVLPEYQGMGVNAIMMSRLQDILDENKIEYLESNLNLETNVNVQSHWKFFRNIQHKRRRAFIKKI